MFGHKAFYARTLSHPIALTSGVTSWAETQSPLPVMHGMRTGPLPSTVWLQSSYCAGYVPYGSDPHTNWLVFAGSLGYRRSRRHPSCSCCVILRQEAGLDPCNWELGRQALPRRD